MTVQFEEAFWDDRYREHESVWSGDPNPLLVSEASDLAPGMALDIGSGEGADSIWLARRGWNVTAVDISSVALARAAAAAAAHDDESARRITWAQHDVTDWAPPAATYDLVSAQFMHLPSAQQGAFFRGLATAVAPGGTLLIVSHHPSDLQTSAGRPALPDLFYTAEDIAATLERAEWQIIVSDARARPANDPEGKPITVRDTVLRARRRADHDD